MTSAPDSKLPARERKKYVLDGEKVIFALNRHWLTIVEPITTVILGLVVVLALDATLPSNVHQIVNVLWWVWFALILRTAYLLYEWRREWFIATNKRMLRVYGVFQRQVAMMPLGKVTDMRYERTIPGRMLGYGTYIMESAGQVQALSEVDFVPNPDKNYRALVAEMFGVQDEGQVDEDLLPDDEDNDEEVVYDPDAPEHLAGTRYAYDDDGRGPDTLDDLPAVQPDDRFRDLRSWDDHFAHRYAPSVHTHHGPVEREDDDAGPIGIHR